ncbi:MAG: hypothetical protein F6K14_08615 [Symploca sp. SIO2C1]|nr:hypothetical protein [Symploca sp. SIO2C1]
MEQSGFSRPEISLQGTLSESAFLVNALRSRDEAISRDGYAYLWVTEEVQKITQEYMAAMGHYDGVELALRSRFFLECMERFECCHPEGYFINLGAGFTSYPYLLKQESKWIEVDLPEVTSWKRVEVERFIREGVLPTRTVKYLSCNLNSPEGIDDLQNNLDSIMQGSPSFVLLEGVSYYLERSCFEYLLKMLSMVQAPGSFLALDYWQPSLSQSEQIRRLRRFFASHFSQDEQDYTFIDSSFFCSLDGYLVVEQTDAPQLHCRYYHEANLDVSATLAEHYVLLKT